VLNRTRGQPAVAKAKAFGPLQRALSPQTVGWPQPAAAASTPRSDADAKVEIEFCGLGKVAFHADDELAVGRYLGGLSKPVARRWLSALLNSDDNRARAAGMYLEGKIGGAGFQPMADQTRDALVQLAVGSGDPAVYATAVSACNAYSEPAKGACERISVNEWARLDPDNAAPWLLVAGKANAQGNAVAAAAAFSHAVGARKVDSYNFSLLAYAEPELPKDATPLERWFLAINAIGIEATVEMPQYRIASKYCSAVSSQDNDLRQRCSELSEVFASKGTNLIDLDFGARLGGRAGWPEGRVAGLLRERDALMQVMMEAAPTGVDNQWNCGAVEIGNAHVRELVQLGELGAGREALARSGETPEELTQKWREFIDKVRQQNAPP
jgi:hypothetical protein